MTLDLNALQEESARLKEGASSGEYLENFVKFPEGNGIVVVRLLGPAAEGTFREGKNPFYCSTRIHRVNNKSIHCLKTLEGKKWVGECPICKYYNWLWKESESKAPEEAARMQAQARAIKPVERYYYNCIVRREVDEKSGEVRTDVGPKILSIGKTLHSMIISGIVGNAEQDEKGYGDVTHPTNGRDFKIIKTMRQSGKESYPNYDTSKYLDISPLGNPEQVKEWNSKVHDLTALRTLRPVDEVKHDLMVHLGMVPAEKDGDPSGLGVTSAAAQTVVHDNPVTTVETSTASESSDDGESMCGDEFFQNLRDLKV